MARSSLPAVISFSLVSLRFSADIAEKGKLAVRVSCP